MHKRFRISLELNNTRICSPQTDVQHGGQYKTTDIVNNELAFGFESCPFINQSDAIDWSLFQFDGLPIKINSWSDDKLQTDLKWILRDMDEICVSKLEVKSGAMEELNIHTFVQFIDKLKQKCHHFDKIFVTSCTRLNIFQYSQWPFFFCQIYQIDVSCPKLVKKDNLIIIICEFSTVTSMV